MGQVGSLVPHTTHDECHTKFDYHRLSILRDLFSVSQLQKVELALVERRMETQARNPIAISMKQNQKGSSPPPPRLQQQTTHPDH